MKFKDYYEILGVPRTVTDDELKKRFRKLAREHHPDVAKDKGASEEKFKEINEAYEVLRDPVKRKRYDELGANWQEGAAPPRRGGRGRPGQPGGVEFEFDGTGFSDFFETFFGGSRGGYGQGPQRSAAYGGGFEDSFQQRGQDVEADILVTLEEAFKGSQRQITLRRPGQRGAADRTDTYQVRIPAGVREGQKIRLANQGEAGHAGGATGDLFLNVRFARHPDFTVKDSDLYYDLDLAPWEAALGAQVKVPALDGETTLRVAPGTSSGQLRLRGLGLPGEKGVRGNLYATVRIQVPNVLTEEEKALWEKLAEISTFKPRA